MASQLILEFRRKFVLKAQLSNTSTEYLNVSSIQIANKKQF